MPTNGIKDLSQQGQRASLLDSEITTAKVNRRSFLARAMGAGTLAVGAAMTAACNNDLDCDDDFADDFQNPGAGDGTDVTDTCDD